MSNNTLQVAENFYSVQAEGWTTGVPAYFIRLAGCNLSCGFSKTGLVNLSRHIKSLPDNKTRAGGLDHEFADLYQSGEASWVCDSASVWLRGNRTSFAEIVLDWEKLKILDWVRENRVHLIWTGGEPTIPAHQESIVKFLDYVYDNNGIKAFNEIETNGTVYIKQHLFEKLDQINCSAKLKNSGMSEDKCIVPEAILRIMEHHNYWFKFVISSEADIEEIIKTYIEPFGIPGMRVILMPALDKPEEFLDKTRMILELAKKYGFIGLTRLQLSWGAVTGV